MSNPVPIPLFPCHTIEDFPTHLRGAEAAGILAAWTVTWHPELIASSGKMPIWSSTDFLSHDLEDRLLLIPSAAAQRLCPEIERLIEQEKCQTLYNLESRQAYLTAPQMAPWLSPDFDPLVAREFFALAYGFLQVQIMTRQIRYSSSLDEQEFESRLVRAAQGAIEQEAELRPLLQACYDLLLEERNRFYPSQPELLDLVMLAPSTLGKRCEKQLESGSKMNLLLTGQLVKTVQAEKPLIFDKIRGAIETGRAEVVGGLANELPSKLMGVESQLNQLARGIEELGSRLGQRPRLFVRRSFGLNPKLPSDLEQFDFSGALHANLGRGTIPEGSATMIQWEATDGTRLPAIQQLPRDAADPGCFLDLGRLIGEALDSYHHSTVLFAHWPDRTCDTFADLQTLSGYGPLLGQFVTASECLEGFYDPGYSERFSDDEYRGRSLADSVAGNVPDPISRMVGYWNRYYQLQRLGSLEMISRFLQRGQSSVETNQNQEAIPAAMDRNDQSVFEEAGAPPNMAELSDQIGKAFAKAGRWQIEPQQGDDLVVVNPLSFGRRVSLHLPGVQMGAVKSAAPIVLADSSPLGTDLVVDLPAWGNVVIPTAEQSGDPLKKEPHVLEGFALRNEFFEVLVDEKTGGILSLNRHRKRGNLLTQRLSLRQPGEGGRGVYAEMVADSVETEQSTRIRGCIRSAGRLMQEGQVVATFEQSITVTRACPEIRVRFKIIPQVDLSERPWENYFCSRWAWHDEAAQIKRESLGSRFFLMEEKIEAPNLIDIETDQAKISLMTMGLPFHRRSARRMLDTLLSVRGESAQEFEMAIAVNVELSTHKGVDLAIDPMVGYSSPGASSAGWLFHASSKNVLATHSRAWLDASGNEVGAMFRFLETEGRNGRLKLTCPREVRAAYRTNFLGERVVDADVEGRTVTVDFTPNQHFQLEMDWES
ncbi:MAG: hypothetical protein VYE64_07685 [Planctomycetota bacterium]|nr:hypothetical protein [Planctomycetota bacterium]